MALFKASSALAAPTKEDAMGMMKAAIMMKNTGQLKIHCQQ
jgi:hypothetical protein